MVNMDKVSRIEMMQDASTVSLVHSCKCFYRKNIVEASIVVEKSGREALDC